MQHITKLCTPQRKIIAYCTIATVSLARFCYNDSVNTLQRYRQFQKTNKNETYYYLFDVNETNGMDSEFEASMVGAYSAFIPNIFKSAIWPIYFTSFIIPNIVMHFNHDCDDKKN